MLRLNDKKVLVLMPAFFDYPAAVLNAIKDCGADVAVMDERPANDFFTKVAIRLGLHFFVRKKIEDYYEAILASSESDKLDYLLLISPETVSDSFIGRLRQKNPGMKVVMYMWDSFSNKKSALKLLPIVDVCFSFDNSDVERYPGLSFLPLFYRDEYRSLSCEGDKDIDILFVGTAHSDRYRVAKAVKQQAEGVGLKVYFYFFSPSKILFYFKSMFDKNTRGIDIRDISFSPLSGGEILSLISRSKVVLDIEHPGQVGLTMRSIEMLGAKKKLMTTNKAIVGYDFYNPNNNILIDRKNPVFNRDVVLSEQVEIDLKTYEKYSIHSWVETLFSS